MFGWIGDSDIAVAVAQVQVCTHTRTVLRREDRRTGCGRSTPFNASGDQLGKGARWIEAESGDVLTF